MKIALMETVPLEKGLVNFNRFWPEPLLLKITERNQSRLTNQFTLYALRVASLTEIELNLGYSIL